jgi:hypothetical protein
MKIFILPDLFGLIAGILVLGIIGEIQKYWILWILIMGIMILIRNIIRIKFASTRKQE